MLEGGQNWTANPTKFVSRWVACFAFVRAKQPPSAGMPAVVIGGYNMAGRVVVFDQDRQNISFTPPINPKIYCGNAKFMPWYIYVPTYICAWCCTIDQHASCECRGSSCNNFQSKPATGLLNK